MNSNEKDIPTSSSAIKSGAAEKATSSKRSLVCKVCGDAASGFNFGAIVCESCKSFYRRHVHRQPNFVCAASSACMLNHDTRRHCPACRLEKCFAVGMRRPSDGNEHLSGVAGYPRRSRYSFFVRRLLQRVTSRQSMTSRCRKSSETTSQSTSIDQQQTTEDVRTGNLSVRCAPTVLNNDSQYEQLYARVSAASKCMLTLANRSISQHETTASASPRDGTVIRLAMSGYIEALQQFTELGRLNRATMRLILREQMLEQLNLYSMFAVNGDTSGWYAVDTLGVLREQAFADFVQCLTHDSAGAVAVAGAGAGACAGDGDGKEQQVQSYVDMFLASVRSFRANFEHDWPLVLLTVSLVNLLSPKHVVQYCSRVDELRKMYQGFLECYLRRQHSVSFQSLLYYCSHEFPSALRRIVHVQRCMLAQLASKSSNGNASSTPISASTTLSTEHASSAQVCRMLEPLVSYITDCLSEYETAS